MYIGALSLGALAVRSASMAAVAMLNIPSSAWSTPSRASHASGVKDLTEERLQAWRTGCYDGNGNLDSGPDRDFGGVEQKVAMLAIGGEVQHLHYCADGGTDHLRQPSVVIGLQGQIALTIPPAIELLRLQS